MKERSPSLAVRHLLDLLNIGLPIIQAPMAGVSSPAMASAVSNAGALGSIGVGAVDAAKAREMIEAVRAATDAPFAANLFCHRPATRKAAVEQAWIETLRPEFVALGAAPPTELREIYRSFLDDADMLRMLLDVRPPVVSFHFGLPGKDAIDALKIAGIGLLACATSLAEARQIEQLGIDVIVAQGWEAGGHRGIFDPDGPDDRLGTAALTSLLARKTALPVVAAGGVMDGNGISEMLDLGAAAVQLGTAFVLCDESLADSGYRAAFKKTSAPQTVMTRVISGRPARCLANRFTALGERMPDAQVPDYPVAYDVGKSLHEAGKKQNDFGYGAQWAGQAAQHARALPAGELVATLAAELEACWA